ncbi:hypothetical protein Taro_051072 [Colocasia esculenta]|uniref:Ion transport domain-containing protein n=1 Tax=Colocasia esculenta TaxID=4460 RepID=A0A843XFI8_COLES|nr:hypothetical protein [Colocasia esculenta]
MHRPILSLALALTASPSQLQRRRRSLVVAVAIADPARSPSTSAAHASRPSASRPSPPAHHRPVRAVGDGGRRAGSMQEFSRTLFNMRPDISLFVSRTVFNSDLCGVLDLVCAPCCIVQCVKDVSVPISVATIILVCAQQRRSSSLSTKQMLSIVSSPCTSNAIFTTFDCKSRAWETFLILLVVYSAWVSPFEFGFLEHSTGGLAIADNVVNGFFTVDIILTFFVAFLDKTTYLLIDNPREIAWRYARTWLGSMRPSAKASP